MRRRRGTARAAVAGALSAATVRAAWTELERRTDAQQLAGDRWIRANYRDRQVSLLLGPAVGVGALAGLAGAVPATRRAAFLAVAGAAIIGGYDDLYGDQHARGLGGHARALRSGRVTTGMVKLVTLTGTAAVAATIRYRKPVDIAIGTVLVAGGANLVNLFDLRPGRALKVTVATAAVLSRAGSRETRAVAAVAAGAALAALPADLGEQAMLGDCGAGTLGALLGWAAGMSGPRARRAVLAAGVVALTVASERVSFSDVIERNRTLRTLDRVGRHRP